MKELRKGKDQSECSIWSKGGAKDGKDQSEGGIWGEGVAKKEKGPIRMLHLG